MRLIDADALKDALFQKHVHEGEELEPMLYLDDAMKVVDEAPTVDAVPVVHARWTTKRTWEHDGEWYCSACEYVPVVFMDSKYCPNCGAHMDGERRECNDEGN